ncbi:Uncharacterised protein [Mycobacterium tuberculosis]|nr:Uncharacterised protein [Mycobacterium tuberculosis]
MVLGVTDHQLSVLVAQVSGIDDRNRRHHGRLSAGIVDICGDNLIDRDWPRQPDDRVIKVGTVRGIVDLGGQHRASGRQGVCGGADVRR